MRSKRSATVGGIITRGDNRLSRYLPMACAFFAFVLVCALWGSLAHPAFSVDESAYLLQARIFAGGKLVGTARPLPEFFQQYHVFVTPVLAAKYPPGHSLIMVPGVWLGFVGLVPALLVAVTAAVLCNILLRFTDAATAVLGVCLATTSDIALHFNPSYFSEVSTAALFMVAWWSLLEYERSGTTSKAAMTVKDARRMTRFAFFKPLHRAAP